MPDPKLALEAAYEELCALDSGEVPTLSDFIMRHSGAYFTEGSAYGMVRKVVGCPVYEWETKEARSKLDKLWAINDALILARAS